MSPEGVRSAGIRNVLVLPKTSATVSSEMWDNGVLRLFGGARADLFAALDHLGNLSPMQFQNVILLSVKANSRRSDTVVEAAAKVFANVALRHEADQWITNLRLSELQLRDGYFSFKRRVGLHLFEPPEDALHLRKGFEAFKADLRSAEITFSTGPRTLAKLGDIPHTGYWVLTEEDVPKAKSATTPTARPETLVRLDCSDAPTRVSRSASDHLGAGIGLCLNPRGGGVQGIDECGRMHVPVIEASATGQSRSRFLSGTDNTNDLIVAIPPEILTTQALRSTLRAEITSMMSDWITKFVPIA